MSLLLDTLFSSVAFSHLIVDVLNGLRPVLLTYLSGPLGLTNANLGMVSTVYILSASLIQPLFGFLTDKIGPRWVVTGGVLWMAAFFTLALVIPGPYALLFLVLASMGSGAFHPAGTMQATLRGRNHIIGKETTATAYFFVFGQMGLFFGPMLGGALLERYGSQGLLIFSLLAIPVGVNAATRLRYAANINIAGGNPVAVQNQVRNSQRIGVDYIAILTFALLAACQSWSQQNMITFIPKFLKDLGQSASLYGLIAAMFMGGSAIGNIVGGNLADQYGKRRVAMLALAMASIPLYLVPEAVTSAWLFLLVPLAGALTGATHSIIVVLAQRFLPGGIALASGLILGFLFTSGALGTLLTGHLADLWGFPIVFHINAGIAMLGALFASTLKRI